MKISVENLGVLREAEFESGDLTLICGDNNTGKTYAIYALYGFLSKWRQWLSVEIPQPTIDALLKEGVTRIDVNPFVKRADDLLKAGCERYTKSLSEVFGTKEDRFKSTRFRVSVDEHAMDAVFERELEKKTRGSEENTIWSISKDAGDSCLTISLLSNDRTNWSPGIVQKVISDSIIELLFADVLPRPFIVSAERTGSTVFRDKLDYKISSPELIKGFMNLFAARASDYPDYPVPVQDNVNFMRRVEHVVKNDSFLALDHKNVLDDFADIIGGGFGVDNGIIYFAPTSGRTRLAMNESSSAVRSLLIIGIYLRHVARKGDLLMVDEPELSLHPKNQRRIARLFARLTKLGIHVFVTTHSDYIVKELNTLIMLNQEDQYLKNLAKQERYQTDELLMPNQFRVYMAKQTAISDRKRSVPEHMLKPASIDHELGIEVSTFDDTINEMNQIQDAIVWGHDG